MLRRRFIHKIPLKYFETKIRIEAQPRYVVLWRPTFFRRIFQGLTLIHQRSDVRSFKMAAKLLTAGSDTISIQTTMNAPPGVPQGSPRGARGPRGPAGVSKIRKNILHINLLRIFALRLGSTIALDCLTWPKVWS